MLAWAGLIFVLSSIPTPFEVLPKAASALPDWLYHGIEYGVFAYLLARALYLSGLSGSIFLLMVWTMFFGMIYALSDEWHQSFVRLRESSVKDFISDTLGIGIGCTFYVTLSVFLKKKDN